MPAVNRKRRTPTTNDSDSDSTPPTRSRPSQSQAQHRRRRPTSPPAPSTAHHSDATPDPTTSSTPTTSPKTLQVKALVRLALSVSVTCTPLRRADINARCGTTAGTFRAVFDDANHVLRDVWGMQLTELPVREDVTLAQRQKKMATQTGIHKGESQAGASSSSKAWILTSALPAAMQNVLGEYAFPPQYRPAAQEASYTALTTFIISLINLSGGSLNESKLNRHLRRVNADASTPVDSTEKTLSRMVKEGYIVKIREGAPGDEPCIEFRVGPRGKVEVGEVGTAGLVRAVYGGEEGEGADAEEVQREELERRIERSLKLSGARAPDQNVVSGNEGAAAETAAGSRGGGRRSRRQRDEDEDD